MFDHPADLRISQKFSPATLLDDVEVVRQLWAVNFFVPIPDTRKTSFIYLATVAFDTG